MITDKLSSWKCFGWKSWSLSLKSPRRDEWLNFKVREIDLFFLNNHLICIDSELRSISRPLPFELQPVFYSPSGIAWLLSLQPLPHMLHCLGIERPSPNTPPLHFIRLNFPSILFVDITTSVQYPVCQDYLYLKYAEMKVEALGMFFVIEEPHATPWIPIACLWCLLLDSCGSSAPATAAHLKIGPWSTELFLRGYAYLAVRSFVSFLFYANRL